MSTFDVDTFLDAAVAEEPMSTEAPLPPEGWYIAEVKRDGVQAREITREDKDDLYLMEVSWVLDDETAREETGFDNPTVRQTVFLDMEEDGTLATRKGKNMQLGRLREAVEQNDPGQQWTPRMLEGARAQVKVEHQSRKNDPSTVDARVARVQKLR